MICDELKGRKYKNITYSCFDKCNNDFWNNFRDYLSSEIVTVHSLYTITTSRKDFTNYQKTF